MPPLTSSSSGAGCWAAAAWQSSSRHSAHSAIRRQVRNWPAAVTIPIISRPAYNRRVEPLLDVRELRLSLPGGGSVRAAPVDGVSFSMARGECVGLVGESGCGKSLTSMTLMGLTRSLPGARIEGQALWDGRRPAGAASAGPIDLLALSERSMLQYRGRSVGMVFQDPLSCLNPLLRLDYQIAEVLRRPQLTDTGQRAGLRGASLKQRIIELLDMVGMPQPEMRAQQYPHQLSGGLRQRALLAIALAGEPELLICDEPTTALDVTIQAQVLATLRRLQQERQLAVLFITHDLGVVAQLCSRVLVMYAGRIVESAPTEAFLRDPQHPYSQGLLASLPGRQQLRSRAGHERLYSIPGSPPRPGQFPPGCRFAPRCPRAADVCRSSYPAMQASAAGQASCWFPGAAADSRPASSAAAVAGEQR
ncbi:ABC transporter ATP-binding protein [bacterium]|nr:ABC transporter ATP-binding protein [bacterium]